MLRARPLLLSALAGTLSHFKCMTILWVPEHNNVPGNDTDLFFHSDGKFICVCVLYSI